METKYFVSEVMTFNDGTKDSVSIYTKATSTEAIATLHKDLGAWMIKDNIATIVIIVFDNYGAVYKKESFIMIIQS